MSIGVLPAEFCRRALEALDASEGRRRRRMRDTGPDVIGLDIKRSLLESAIRDDPEPEAFEGWLLEQTLAHAHGRGGVRAMATAIWDEWRLASLSGSFSDWLAQGAPSDDRSVG